MTATHGKVTHTSAGAKTLNLLASVKFAVSVVILIALACIVGTILPQGSDVARFVEKNPAAADRMELFSKLGLTHVFYSKWFVGLLCVLSASVATCSVRRFSTVLRTDGFARRRALGSMLTHISILLILAGGVIRGVWGEKGYLELRRGQTANQFVVENGTKALPFAVHLKKFEIDTYDTVDAAVREKSPDILHVQWPEKNVHKHFPAVLDEEHVLASNGGPPMPENSFRIKVLSYMPDFVVDTKTRVVSSRSDEPNNPAVLVEVVGPNYRGSHWLFANYPEFSMANSNGHGQAAPSPLKIVYESRDKAPQAAVMGPIKSFKSTLHLVEGDEIVKTTTVEVNSPLKHKGYTFYQSGYNPRDLNYTSLQVVKDPGIPVVYAGFSLIIVGLFIVFYLNPWLESRRKSA